MSWSGISSSTWPTNNDVLDAIANSVFDLKSGQSVSANNNWITVSEANTKLDIDTISGDGSRWPTKSEFSAAITYYSAGTAYAGSSSDIACELSSGGFTIYTTNSSGLLDVGDIVYVYNGSEYEEYSYSGSDNYLSYTESSVRKWLEFTEGALISDKGTCLIDNLISISSWEHNSGNDYIYVTAQFSPASAIRVRIQFTGVNGHSGSPNPIIDNFIPTGQLNLGSSVNIGASATIASVWVYLTPDPSGLYPPEDATYKYIPNTTTRYRNEWI